jgi:hypothetical protein
MDWHGRPLPGGLLTVLVDPTDPKRNIPYVLCPFKVI